MRCTLLAAALLSAGCSSSPDRAPSSPHDTLLVFSAASLAAPLHVALDSFASREKVVIQEEHGASVELARRMTALGRTPDVVALADHEVFPELLVPAVTSWYATFARNRLVVAYTNRSRQAGEITAGNWHEVLQRRDVTLGRSDPAIAPVGYRALLMYALAERFYHQPGLAQRLATRTTQSQIRGNATELAALLAAGELDYIIDYESLARSHGFRYVVLPAQVDLSDPQLAALYSTAVVRVPRLTDSVTRHGSPIVYGVSIPRTAPHRAAAERFLAFMLGTGGRAILRAQAIDMLEAPLVVGDSAPQVLWQSR